MHKSAAPRTIHAMAPLNSAAGKFSLLVIFVFFVGTLLRLSFSESQYVPHLHRGGPPADEKPSSAAPTSSPEQVDYELPPTHGEPHFPESSHPQSEKVKLSGGANDIFNATLGFQKIYVLSMRTRSDERDQIMLSAYISGLEIEFVDGVNGTLMSKGERPDGWEKAFGVDGNLDASLGCWRGHMDIYQK